MAANKDEFERIMSLTNQEAIIDLENIYRDLMLLKAQLRSHAEQLTHNELEEKLQQQLDMNELYGDMLSETMKNLATKSEKLTQLENQQQKDIEETTKILEEKPCLSVSASTSTTDVKSQSSLSSDTKTVTLEETPSSSEGVVPITRRNSSTEKAAPAGTAPKSAEPGTERCSGQSASKTYVGMNEDLSYLGKTFGNQRRDLLALCQKIIRPYGIPMYEFSTSWIDGHAYCALIHHFLPHLVDTRYIYSKDVDATLQYVNSLVKSLGVEFDGDMVKFYKLRRPSYVKTCGFVLKLVRQLETLKNRKDP